MRSTKSEAVNRDHNHINGQTRVQTLFTEDRRGSPPRSQDTRANGIIKGEVHVERPPSVYDERPVDIQDLEIRQKKDVSNVSVSKRISNEPSGISTNFKQPNPFIQRQDVTRSSSGQSKRDWNEHVRKKHLPPIFVNEGFVVGDNSPTVEEDQSVKTVAKQVPHVGINSLHFYMSSDYHPDCLTESLPRRKLNQCPSTESEAGDSYTNDDIDEVLENESVTDMQIVKARAARVYDQGVSNELKTFTSVRNEAKRKDISAKGVYGTFEDLSKMYLRDEGEIELDNGDIAMDEIKTSYVPDILYTRPINTVTYNTQPMKMHFSSFKPDDISLGKRSTQEVQQPKIPLRKSPYAETTDVYSQSTSFITPFNERDNNSFWYDRSMTGGQSTGLGYVKQLNKNDTSVLPINSYSGTSVLNIDRKLDNQTSDKLSISETETQVSFGESTGFSVSGLELLQSGEQNVTSSKSRDNSIDDENASSGSNSSVTVSPYKGETRRRPWMNDFELQNDEHPEITEPLVQDSDTDTLRDSHESSDLRFGMTYDPRYANATHSGLSTPVSSIFDEETDRGFEDALEQHISGANVYGGVGLCFESIKEEPEDLTSSGSNPFLDSMHLSNGDEDFRTQAVISRNSNSRTSSSASISDNPFCSSPGLSHSKESLNSARPSEIKYKAPVIITTDTEAEFGDSGFTSGLERGNLSDSSGHQEITPGGRNSPWPEEDTGKRLVCSFESNFCDGGEEVSDWLGNTRGSENVKKDGVKKPLNKLLENLRSDTRPQPVRVKSLERTSPSSARKLPRRGHSFEGLRTDVKPAYF